MPSQRAKQSINGVTEHHFKDSVIGTNRDLNNPRQLIEQALIYYKKQEFEKAESSVRYLLQLEPGEQHDNDSS